MFKLCNDHLSKQRPCRRPTALHRVAIVTVLFGSDFLTY